MKGQYKNLKVCEKGSALAIEESTPISGTSRGPEKSGDRSGTGRYHATDPTPAPIQSLPTAQPPIAPGCIWFNARSDLKRVPSSINENEKARNFYEHRNSSDRDAISCSPYDGWIEVDSDEKFEEIHRAQTYSPRNREKTRGRMMSPQRDEINTKEKTNLKTKTSEPEGGARAPTNESDKRVQGKKKTP